MAILRTKTAPAASLKPLDMASLRSIEQWGDELAAAEEWSMGLAEPFDDAPSFDDVADPEVDVNARLKSDKAFMRSPTRRLFADYRANPAAYKHIETLPKAGETLHGVISGKYAMFELIPALIQRIGQNIGDLHIATLSYGKQNAADLLDMIDAGQVKRCTLLVSYYFKSQNRPLYDSLVPELLQRGHRVLAMRTHAKICLLKMSRGTRYVIEGSANLRSCKNLEQFTLTRCPKLYRFHQTWIEDELFKPRQKEAADAD